MVWVAVGVAAVGAVVAVAGAEGEAGVAAANTAGGRKIAEQKNKERGHNNLASAAKGGLARWAQSLQNQRHLTAGGENLLALDTNFNRQRDMILRQGFVKGANYAEAAGAARASQAASGARGSVVDNVNAATALRASMAEQETRDVLDMQSRDIIVKRNAVRSQMIQGLDSSVILDNMNGTPATSQVQQGPSVGMAAFKGALQVASAYGNNVQTTQAPTESTSSTQSFGFKFGDSGDMNTSRSQDNNPYSLFGATGSNDVFGN